MFAWRTGTKRFHLKEYVAIYTDYRRVEDWPSYDEYTIEIVQPGGKDTIREVMYSEKIFKAVIDLLREYATLELRRGGAYKV